MLVLNGLAWSGQKVKGKKDESKETVEMAAKAKVTIDQAIKTASEKVSGKVVEAELEKKHAVLVWEVEVVTAENTVMESHIDAESGAVIDVEDENAEKDMNSKQMREGTQQQALSESGSQQNQQITVGPECAPQAVQATHQRRRPMSTTRHDEARCLACIRPPLKDEISTAG